MSSVNAPIDTISREGNMHFRKGSLLYEVYDMLQRSKIEYKKEIIEIMEFNFLKKLKKLLKRYQ
jgi:hypothetical protein